MAFKVERQLKRRINQSLSQNSSSSIPWLPKPTFELAKIKEVEINKDDKGNIETPSHTRDVKCF